jgi:DNA-binding transcriptional MocR family regulator
MVFKPVGRGASLVDTVVEQVQHLISEGHLESGDRLPKEDELVTQLGVSRTVLREALTASKPRASSRSSGAGACSSPSPTAWPPAPASSETR